MKAKNNGDQSRRQITPNSVFRIMAITSFKDCITKGLQKRNGDHFRGHLLALLSDQFFVVSTKFSI